VYHPTGPAVRVLDVVSLAMWASLWATSSVTVSDVMPVIRKVACMPPYTLQGEKRGMGRAQEGGEGASLRANGPQEHVAQGAS
jgi:hypothetical protein